MATVKDIYDALDRWAPFATQMDFDNAGFLVGYGEQNVTQIVVALDITEDVIHEAVEKKAELIVAHHPVIFHPVRALTDETTTGKKLLKMVKYNISAICAHTNLDAAQGGVNSALAKALQLREVQHLHPDGEDEQGRVYGIGRVGFVHREGMTAEEYARFVKEKLGTSSVRFADADKPVHKVAVGGGSCGSMLSDAIRMGCDTFVTADVKHDQFLEAQMLGINLMDAGHFATEDVICPEIVAYMEKNFPDVKVWQAAHDKESYRSV